jgi:hypothetical protein
MIILIVFGAIQDVIFHAPMGSFEVVNLLTYAASTAISAQFDITSEPLIAIVATDAPVCRSVPVALDHGFDARGPSGADITAVRGDADDRPCCMR